MSKVYDTIIIGGGPAGLAAALYSSRAKVDTLLLERGKFGGQAASTEELENYPGSIEDPTGPKLTERMRQQAEHFGTEIVKDDVVDLDLEGEIKTIKTRKGEYQAKTVIVSTGAKSRPAGFKNESELIGKGVSYCATCDAAFFEELSVAVIGGGDSAFDEAIYLTKFAEEVTIVYRKGEENVRAAKSVVERAKANDRIKFMWHTEVEEAIDDDGILGGLKVKNNQTGETDELEVEGCFVFVGLLPNSKLFEGKLDLTNRGEIITDEDMKTNIPGVYAVGDVRKKTLRQVITAAADGAIAATQVEHYINK